MPNWLLNMEVVINTHENSTKKHTLLISNKPMNQGITQKCAQLSFESKHPLGCYGECKENKDEQPFLPHSLLQEGVGTHHLPLSFA